MEPTLIVKILAVGLTVSQLFNQPLDKFKPAFDPRTEQAQVETLLTEGCKFMIKEFKADEIDFDNLFGMMMDNATEAKTEAEKDKAKTEGRSATESFTDKLMKEIDFPGLYAVYKKYCKGEKIESSSIELDKVINFYNEALANLPDPSVLKGRKLPSASVIYDKDDVKFTEVYPEDGRRHWISIKDLPVYVKNAFVAAEDQNFYKHNGLDIRGIVRAFATNMSGEGRPQGGSTITQQVIKNLLLDDSLKFERKIREMVLATRLEKILSKEEILELYINYVYFGRASWGIEMAAQSYFGKPANQLSPAEAALLAGLVKGPTRYHVDLHQDRALDRRKYVIDRMKKDTYLNPVQADEANATPITVIRHDPPRGYYFIDEIVRQVRREKNPLIPDLTAGSFSIYSTLDSKLQKITNRALLNGLTRYEAEAPGKIRGTHRAQFEGPEGSLAEDIAKYKRSWKEILPKARAKSYDLPWMLATVVKAAGEATQVGLPDGRVIPLLGPASALRSLKLYDLVFVETTEGKKARAQLQIPPHVQGAVVVMENKTGNILAMSGGFSYPRSPLNRATQGAGRQTGSTLKPFIYLAALNRGFQPNTLIPDLPMRFEPINKGGRVWKPKNYDGTSHGLVTIRQAIENSLNWPTARMMAALGSPGNPAEGLDYVQAVTTELGIYKSPRREYPFVLGAQPARLLDMVTAYATVANDGLKPTPQFIDKIYQGEQKVWERKRFDLQPLRSIDRVAFYQLRRILEGTITRGTANRLKRWGGSVAGKTGTSNNENDAWFISFTNDITVGVWVGYDKRNIYPSLGDKFTGGRVALPIAEEILEASFSAYRPRSLLPGAPSEIADQVYEAYVNGIQELGGINVFRLDKVSHLLHQTRNDLVEGSQFASLPLLQDIPYDDQPDDQSYVLDDVDDVQPEFERNSADEHYQPGAEEPEQTLRRRRREVEPIFAQPVFFKLKETL